MNAWNPSGQPPYDPQRQYPNPPPQGPYVPPPPQPNGGYAPPQPNGGYPPHIPHPYPPGPPHPNQPQPYPVPAPTPGPIARLRQRIGPIHTARRVFKPSRPGIVEDAVVARIQKIRTIVGLCAVVWVSMSYKLAKSVGDVASDRLNQSWISVLVLAVTFPVIVGILLALAHPAARRELLRRAARSFGAIVAIVAGVFVFPASVLTGFVDGRFATNPLMTVITYAGTLFTLVWVLPFVIWGIGLALVHVFRTADIHETMPPVLAMTLVWEMTLTDLFTGAYASVPGPIRAVFMLGAPLSVTAVGLWELRRLRVQYGITLRGVLMR